MSPIPALDAIALGHPKFPYKEFIKRWPKGWALKTFDCEDTFGRSIKRIREMLEQCEIPEVVIQQHWGGKSHVLTPMPKLRRKLPEYERLQHDFSDRRIFVSHSCEYRCSDKAAIQQRLHSIHALSPSCLAVSTPEGGSPFVGGIHEIHAKTDRNGSPGPAVGPGEITSLDGLDMRDCSLDIWSKKVDKARIAAVWITDFNMSERGKAVILPQKNRTFIPTPKTIQFVIDAFSDYFHV